MELSFWAATDVGRVRDHNEDNFLVDKKLQLFVVCDGMGGHAAGEVASAVCVRTVREVVVPEAELLAHLRQNPDDEAAAAKVVQLMGRAVRTANARIFEMAQQDASRRGMGTTCVSLVIAGSRGYVGHVGDSRIYRLRDGEVEQITTDHSLLNEMIRQGKIPADTSEENFPHKNAVTRAVGVREKVEVDAFSFPIKEADRLLICSDGLSEYLTAKVDLVDMIGGAEPRATAERCIEHANNSGGKDNITVAVIDALSAGASAEEGVEREKVIEILRNTAYFHYLAPPELEQIRRMARRVEVEADQAVVGEDEDNQHMFLILKGSVSLQLDGDQVAVLTTGEHFGEMALIDAQDENDTNLVARSLEPSILLAISRDQFVGLLRTAPSLAMKLLWNFVQVFADRLQSVPPEYRFTPDEWRSDPEAIADVTPPSGKLVFEEDKGRIRESTPHGEVTLDVAGLKSRRSGFGESRSTVTTSTDLEPLPPSVGAGSRGKGEEDKEKKVDLRATMSLDAVDPSLLDSSPPKTGRMNARAERRDEPSPVDRGLSSGTYDQSILEGGVDGLSEDSEEPPSVTINSPSEKSSGARRAGMNSSSKKRENLRKTMKLDWDSDELEGVTPPMPASARTKKKGGDRPVVAKGILNKARQKGEGAGKEPVQKAKTAPLTGESDVQDDSSAPTAELSNPKIMISPDLMADVEEDE